MTSDARKSLVGLGVSTSVKTRMHADRCMDRLVEWIGPIGLSVLPTGEKSERPYFGVRRENGAVVKRKRRLPYSFSFTWLNVKTSIVLVSERELRLVTSLTVRAVFGYVFGVVGALMCALGLMPGVLLKMAAVLALSAALFVLLSYSRMCIVRESKLLRRALEEADGAGANPEHAALLI